MCRHRPGANLLLVSPYNRGPQGTGNYPIPGTTQVPAPLRCCLAPSFWCCSASSSPQDLGAKHDWHSPWLARNCPAMGQVPTSSRFYVESSPHSPGLAGNCFILHYTVQRCLGLASEQDSSQPAWGGMGKPRWIQSLFPCPQGRRALQQHLSPSPLHIRISPNVHRDRRQLLLQAAELP